MAVAIKISYTHHAIASQNSRPGHGTDANVVVEIRYPGLPRAAVEQKVIWMAVAVKVSWRRRGWLTESDRARSNGGKGASHSGRSEFIDGAAIRRKQIARAVKGQTRRSKPRRKGGSHPGRSEFINLTDDPIAH